MERAEELVGARVELLGAVELKILDFTVTREGEALLGLGRRLEGELTVLGNVKRETGVALSKQLDNVAFVLGSEVGVALGQAVDNVVAVELERLEVRGAEANGGLDGVLMRGGKSGRSGGEDGKSLELHCECRREISELYILLFGIVYVILWSLMDISMILCSK